MIYGKNLETLKNQFHSKSVSFNNFKNMTQNDIDRIKKLVERKKGFTNKPSIYGNLGLMNYTNTLQYLINPTISQELKTFDEKIMYLILAVDPELQTIKTFIETEIIPISDINEETDEKRKEELKKLRKEQQSAYISDVRKKIGFYDQELIKYESILHRGLLKEEGFISGVKAPSIGTIIRNATLVKNLNIVSENTLQRLKSICERWYVEAKDPSDLNSLAYNLLNNYKALHIYTVEEQVLLFILIGDPNLDLLKIFEEESNYNKMKERALKELGFYGKGLISVEQYYHDRFEPETKLSAWTK